VDQQPTPAARPVDVGHVGGLGEQHGVGAWRAVVIRRETHAPRGLGVDIETQGGGSSEERGGETAGPMHKGRQATPAFIRLASESWRTGGVTPRPRSRHAGPALRMRRCFAVVDGRRRQPLTRSESERRQSQISCCFAHHQGDLAPGSAWAAKGNASRPTSTSPRWGEIRAGEHLRWWSCRPLVWGRESQRSLRARS